MADRKTAYFRLENLSVGYDRRALIRDICAEIGRGEIVTLIGPNGAGKSTILKSVSRQLAPVGGSVLIDGKNLNAFSHKELSSRMAVVLTDRPRPELMRCIDVAAAGRYPYTGRLGILTEADWTKVRAAMAQAGAEDIAEREFSEISDGQKQRVLLARAICQEPEVIVLDEPTSFLDVRHKIELLTVLRGMAKEKGVTILLSLHEIDLAMKLSDRVICVKGDTIQAFGSPEEIFTEARMRALYEIDQGAYDVLFGSVELPAVSGTPEVFVISSGGTGIPVYRRLQREGIPFAAGILYRNDVDYCLAKRLACTVVTEEPFRAIGDAAMRSAAALVQGCARVIDAGIVVGESNRRMTELIDAARKEGKLERLKETG